MLPLRVSWETPSGVPVQTPNYVTGVDLASDFVLGVSTFGRLTDPVTVVLRNTAYDRRIALGATGLYSPQTPEKLENIRFYLTGDPQTLAVLMSEWPKLGCGVELSFDNGRSWRLLSAVPVTLPNGTRVTPWGDPATASTWIPLPGSSVAANANDGELLAYAPYDRAQILLRVQIPSQSSMQGLFQYSLGIDYDVL